VKVIIDLSNERPWPRQARCKHCSSIIELTEDEVEVNSGYQFIPRLAYRCPCCKAYTEFVELMPGFKYGKP